MPLKRAVVFTVLALFLAAEASYGWEKELRPTSPVNFGFAFRGGFFFPEDRDFTDFYGRWSNDIYFLEFDWYFFNNFYLEATSGFYYQDSTTIGTITPIHSDEHLQLYLVPLEAGLGYRFRFRPDQFIVPFIGGGYDWIYFNEDSDPGSTVDGWKEGYTAWAGLLILLDRLEPYVAWDMYKNWRIDNSSFEIGVRYTRAGDEDGLNLSGFTYTLGLLFEF